MDKSLNQFNHYQPDDDDDDEPGDIPEIKPC